MISLCSVLIDGIENFKQVLVDSITKKLTLVKEVIFANNSKEPGYNSSFEINGILFKEFGSQEHLGFGDPGNQHAFGMHYAINRASNDYILLCDPDVFFYSNVDEIYYNLMKKYDLNLVGCSHHAATELSQTFFPWHGNMMFKLQDLPKKNFTNEGLEGKWLMREIGKSHAEMYPNPTGNFDTSSGLYLYAKTNNWKWLSFQTTDTHQYTTKYYRSNIKIKDKLNQEKLIYHAVSGTIEPSVWSEYYENYKKSL